VDERAVRGAGDIPKLSSQVGRVTRAPESQHPVLGLAIVRILRVRVGLALTDTRRQTRLIPIFGRTFAEVDKCVKLREALLDLTRQRTF